MLKYALTAAALAATMLPAEAQQTACAERTKLLNNLETRFGEARQSFGLSANNSLIEVYASPDSGTWTILVTTAQGVTCILASGQSFENTKNDVTPVRGEML